MGALWQSAGRLYYAAVAVGQLEFEGKAVFCLSAEAPVFQALRLKKQHDNVLFNGSTWLIESVD
jgi:hypothetical protein